MRVPVLGVGFVLCGSIATWVLQPSAPIGAKAALELIRSTQSGPWSAAAKWEGGGVPGAGDRVQVREGHTVTYDVESDAPVRLIHVAGTLTFATDKNTRLDVGLIKIQATLTGEDSRAAEVSNVEFPTLLHSVDDRPPATVITRVVAEGGKVRVYGTTSDDGPVKRVVVNGRDATADIANFAQWNVVLDGADTGKIKISAHAEDEAGNVEMRPHVWAN